MKLDFEYGQGLMSANLPDNTDIFVPGETVPDPECLPQDWDTLYGETLKSIRNPIGMKPLRELAHKGQHRRHHHPGYRQGRKPADQPPQGRHPRLHRRAVFRRRGEKGYPAVLQRSAPAHERAGDEDHPRRRAVWRILLYRPDHQPRQRGITSTSSIWAIPTTATTSS